MSLQANRALYYLNDFALPLFGGSGIDRIAAQMRQWFFRCVRTMRCRGNSLLRLLQYSDTSVIVSCATSGPFIDSLCIPSCWNSDFWLQVYLHMFSSFLYISVPTVRSPLAVQYSRLFSPPTHLSLRSTIETEPLFY